MSRSLENHPARSSYVVVALTMAELDAVRAAGTDILYQGEASGLALTLGEPPPGLVYAVLSGADPITQPGLESLLVAEVLEVEFAAAQLEARMVALRSRLPGPPPGADRSDLAEDRVGEVAAALEVCLHDRLVPLRNALRTAARVEPSVETKR